MSRSLDPRRRRRALVLASLAAVACAPLFALPHTPEKARLELQADRTAYAPGESGRLVAMIRVENGWHINSHQPTYDYLIPTAVDVRLPEGWSPAQLGYPRGELARFTFAQEPLSVYQGDVAIIARFAVPQSAGSRDLPVVVTLTYQACNDTQCLPPVHREEKAWLRIGSGGQPTASGYFAPRRGGVAPAGADTPSRRLAWMLALGLLGGLVLNAMPCVLPVLSLKVFSLVKSARLSRRQVALGGLATTFGILSSFWGLAAAAVLARRAGTAVGWGIHFQEPAFVALLAVVVVLFTLNLWGLFEIRLPGRVADLAGGQVREGVVGDFATGLFATLMATPCSAPFLGTAIGFALSQRALTVFGIFTAVGLGMSAPYLVLAVWPGAARLFPKPGPWMVRLKEVMGFLLAGAAIWLFYVLGQEVSATWLALVQVAILALCLAVWLGRSASTGWRLGAAMLAVLATGVGAVWLAAVAPPPQHVLAEKGSGLIAWVPFDRVRAEHLAAAGTPVFVDVTADWCVTCKVNERLVLDTPEVAHAFSAGGVVAMRADWTTRDRKIGDFLAEHGRYGIPFYLLYRAGGESRLFPELITRALVVAALRDGGEPAAAP